ncbi:MAG: hypothetical protein PG981_000528 [Wolbachia endosymbiont of Ctenocephalides orientis wCori]|nr:MAG: hypothetical protein PG981_000528 [Wolbachia endosymbiont of Ctenocephalides orientis wCori]
MLEDFQLLLTIPGIGEESAIAILAEIPDIKAFVNDRQLAAYAGTIPQNITSGSSVHAKPRSSIIWPLWELQCVVAPYCFWRFKFKKGV